MHFRLYEMLIIHRFGPPRNVWTMRFEAKHTFFKRAVSKNFKNIPKSLAFRHQRYVLFLQKLINLIPINCEMVICIIIHKISNYFAEICAGIF
jgi:hypothetical protein